MGALWIMLKNVVVFVLLAIPGFLLVKTKLIKGAQSAILSKLLTYVGMPFLILSSTLNVTFSGEFTKSIILTAVIGVVFVLLMFFITALLVSKKEETKRRGMLRFCMTFANNGFLGIPLAKAVFGESPVLTYLIILNIITNVLMFTLGVYLISGDKKTISLKKALLSPVLIAFVLGIVLNLVKVKSYLPEVADYSNYFSNIVTPLSMTILGVKMADVRLVKIFSGWRTYYVSAIKLIVFPVLGVAIMFLLKLFCPVNSEMIFGMFIAYAVPTAGLSSAFADQYNGDTENAVVLTLGTTLLSVVTLPILYWLLCMML